MDDQNNYLPWIIGGIALLIVVILFGVWIFTTRGAVKPGLNATSTAATTTVDAGARASTSANGEMIAVADQAAGETVVLSSADLKKAGWIAIRDSRGWTLGAAWLPAGSQKNVSVSLLRRTSAGESYTAVVHVDDGDKKFDIKRDALIDDVSAAFKVN